MLGRKETAKQTFFMPKYTDLFWTDLFPNSNWCKHMLAGREVYIIPLWFNSHTNKVQL